MNWGTEPGRTFKPTQFHGKWKTGEMPSVAKSTPMKNWDWESVNMMDPTCTECERLLQTFEHAIRCLQIIEHKSAMETGLKGILRKASNRCEEARKAIEDHETTHMTVMAAAGGVV